MPIARLASDPVPLPRAKPGVEAIPVRAKVISSFDGTSQTRFGKLVWLGGLSLSSDDPLFGGFSGISFLDAQNFLAIGDKGSVLAGRLVVEDGRPVDLVDARLGVLPGLSLSQKGWQRDAEGFDIVGDQAFVSFEGIVRVMAYDIRNGVLARVSSRLPLTRDILESNKGNKGLEALAFPPATGPLAGSFFTFSEETEQERVLGWIVRDGKAERITLPQSSGLLVTDAAFAANGDLLVLERNFSLLGGLVVQIRRVKSADVWPGHVQETDLLLRATLSDEIDNMEGLAIQPQGDGSSLITLISDDNFNSFQRTLLLQFLLPAGP